MASVKNNCSRFFATVATASRDVILLYGHALFFNRKSIVVLSRCHVVAVDENEILTRDDDAISVFFCVRIQRSREFAQGVRWFANPVNFSVEVFFFFFFL